MPDGPIANLVLRHGRNHLVVYEQPINVQRLVAGRIRGLELDRFAALRIGHARDQGRFEQFRFVLELLNESPLLAPTGPSAGADSG